MGLIPLSKMDDYELVDKDQDLRGWKVQDATGKKLGKVAEMLVDTDKERVTTLLLDNNAEYSIEDLELGDHVLLLTLQGQANVVPLDADVVNSGKVVGTAQATGDNERRGAVESELRMPVIEEQLRVGKRQVDKGGVRVTRRVQDRPVQRQVELREERVDVTRRPADRPVDPAAVGALAELNIEVVERAEVPVVIKQERVVEEVVINKQVAERTETVRDTVRRTDVVVEDLSGKDDLQTRRDRYAQYEPEFRQNYSQTYANSEYDYDRVAPAYRFGTELGNLDQHKDWQSLESDARTHWEKRNPGRRQVMARALSHVRPSHLEIGRAHV